MLSLDLNASVVDWCIEYPQSLAFFQEQGIDYCCGGKSLEYACRQRSLDPAWVLAQLEQLLANSSAPQSRHRREENGVERTFPGP